MITNLGPANLSTDHSTSIHAQPVLVLTWTDEARGITETGDLVLLEATHQERDQLAAAGYMIRLGYRLRSEIPAP